MNSFVFYKSFYDAMKMLDKDERCEFMDFICNLAFEGIEPDLSRSTDIVKVLYTVSAEQIKASIAHKLNGTKGGRPRNETLENEVKRGVLTGVKSNVNVNVNENVNANAKVNVNSSNNLTLPDIQNIIKDFASENGLRFGAKTINELTDSLSKTLDPAGNLSAQLDFIRSKYPDKKGAELTKLFISSLHWDTQKPKAKKSNIKSIDYSSAPKKCDCGGEITPFGVPYSVMCIKCRKTWELKNDVWICDGAS